jgi:MFS family permease
MFRTVGPLSSIIALRFLGLFLVLPVLSVYALELEGATQFLVGITLGGYALTQMILQVPFGILSDRIGRKRTIAIGLGILVLGSIVCAVSNDIYTLMFGRFLQGAGAIGAVGSALLSDLVKEEMRSRKLCIFNGAWTSSRWYVWCWCAFLDYGFLCSFGYLGTLCQSAKPASHYPRL